MDETISPKNKHGNPESRLSHRSLHSLRSKLWGITTTFQDGFPVIPRWSLLSSGILDPARNKREQSEVLIIMLRYLLDKKERSSKDSDDNKSIAETEIEEMEIKLGEKGIEDLTVKYFVDKESEKIEYRAQIDLYQRRVYDELHAFLDTDDRIVAEAKNEEEGEYTAEEAKKTLEEVQYSSILGINLVDNYEEYRRLDQWIMFNPAIFALFQFIYNLNKDVDYRPPA